MLIKFERCAAVTVGFGLQRCAEMESKNDSQSGAEGEMHLTVLQFDALISNAQRVAACQRKLAHLLD